MKIGDSRARPECSETVPFMAPPEMEIGTCPGVGLMGIVNGVERSTTVPLPKSTEIEYCPGSASTIWKLPGLTMGPLKIPEPENLPVPFIVPNDERFSEVSVSNVPEPMNVA
jgi:hypothetical protein